MNTIVAYKLVFLGMSFICIFSCTDNDTNLIEGEIYITLINVYNPRVLLPEDKLEILKDSILNFDFKDTSEPEIKLFSYYKSLIENDLFDKPCFQLKLKNENIINAYANEKEYNKLKEYLDKLDVEKEKILVKFKGAKMSEGIYNRSIYSVDKIVSIEKTLGETDWHK